MQRKNGFTLIELLVVVAIIAVLITMLLSSLHQTRVNAKVTVCISQLRQWGQIHSIYNQENNGWFKHTNRPYWAYPTPETVNTDDYVKYFTDKFGISLTLFTCPFTPGFIIDDPTSHVTHTGYTYLGSIDETKYNYFRNDYHSPRQVDQCETWWVLMTDKAKGWPGPENTNHWINGQMAVSLLFLDGHVEHQTHVWPQDPPIVPLYLVNYGADWCGWDFNFRIVWKRKMY